MDDEGYLLRAKHLDYSTLPVVAVLPDEKHHNESDWDKHEIGRVSSLGSKS